jgi:hypothetical protein
MSDKYRSAKNKWDKNNLDKVKESKAKYDKENPVWAFRPDEELRKWLEKSRLKDEQGKSESNATIVLRKLKKLMKIEENLNQ